MTAGWTVVQVTVAVAVVEFGLLGLIIRQVCDFSFIHASWIILIYLVIGIRFFKIFVHVSESSMIICINIQFNFRNFYNKGPQSKRK